MRARRLVTALSLLMVPAIGYAQQTAADSVPRAGTWAAEATYAKATPDIRTWTTGVYGELGAVYFLTPHVSLGGTGELQVTYGKRDQPTGPTGAKIKQTTTVVGGSLMRVMLSVYF